MPATRGRPDGARDYGTVTAEVAVLLPGVVLMLSLVLSVAAVAVTRMQCQDAARSAARVAARGEPDAAAVVAARLTAPRGAEVGVSTGGGVVRVRVATTLSVPLPGAPGFRVEATAVARPESGTP